MLICFMAVIPVYLKTLNKRRWLYASEKCSAPAVLIEDNDEA